MAPKSAAVLQHWFLPAANGAVMRALCETAKPNQRTVVLGYWHDINPGATTFACLKQAPGLSYGAFPKAPRWRHLDKKNPDHQRFLRVTDFDQYVTLDYEGTDRQTIYQQETAYMRPLPEILSQHPDFKPIKKQRVGNYSLNIYSREGNQVAGSQDLLKYLREQR